MHYFTYMRNGCEKTDNILCMKIKNIVRICEKYQFFMDTHYSHRKEVMQVI